VLLAACAREPAPMEAEGSTTGTAESSTTGTTEGSGSTGDPGSSSGEVESSTSTGGGSEGSSTGRVCTRSDACREATDCPLPEAECIECTCVGGVGCLQWGAGAWGPCLIDGMADTTACEAGDAQCLPDEQGAPMGATCVFPGCDDACDCPEPPRGFEAQVACGDVANNGGELLECYISCEAGEACPAGWSCAQQLYCVREGLVTLDPWGDCSGGDICPDEGSDDGVCIRAATGSVCSTTICADAVDCADAPDTGMSLPACGDVTGDLVPECYLDCDNGRACPDGMTCEASTLCVWA
jgi:hypothetical protein